MDAFKEGNQLEFEENDRINGWASHIGVEITHQIADKTQINALFNTAIEVIIRNEFI